MKVQTGQGTIPLITLVGIFSISALNALPGLAVSPILGDLNKIFPSATDLEIQMLSSLPSLLIIPFILLSGKLTEKVNNLLLLQIGLALFGASGILYLLSDKMWQLIAVSAMLGMGSGLIVPLSTGLISRYFVGSYRTKQFGYSSIFVSLEPIWVFIISVLFYKEKVTWMKVLGIGMGLGGAVLCIFTQPSDDLASNAPLGNLMCLASSLVYAVYLVFSNRLLKGVGDMTMLKYTFLGAAVMAVVVNTIYGFDAPILKMSLFSTPMLVLLFVLVFPTTISYLLLPLGLQINCTLRIYLRSINQISATDNLFQDMSRFVYCI
jgi:drug/metabolite transporter (DMT)-like permease